MLASAIRGIRQEPGALRFGIALARIDNDMTDVWYVFRDGVAFSADLDA